tara:strand:+ start:63491 stop:63667 length:177 start_codon:yes stop_codon:yes gene_type:complete
MKKLSNLFRNSKGPKRSNSNFNTSNYLPIGNSCEGCEFSEQRTNLDENPFIATELGAY